MFSPFLLVGEEEDSNYILTAGDVVNVQVFGQPDLQTTQEISNRGEINMGLIGAINVAGIPIPAAEEKINKAYVEERFLRNPQIIISVSQYSPKVVSVLGQVNRPGSVQLPNDTNSLSLARIISLVGDFRGVARKDAIRVVRKDLNGKETTIIVDMSNIGKSSGSGSNDIDFLIYPNDVIYVPERLF